MGVIIMNAEERLRKAVFEMVRQKKLTLIQASIQCSLSYRQALRIYQLYKMKGDAGLTHQSRGRRSNRKHPHQASIIARYIERYEGFGPTLAVEYLIEDGYVINRETLRRWLLSEGLWKKTRKRSPHRRQRERCAQFGELIQIDGSIHDWFGIGVHSCLLNMVDDATGKTFSLLASGETTRVVFLCLWKWIEAHGIPLALYVDLKTVYVSPKDDGFSHLQLACAKLGIRIIKARSPQAKGRVERNHAVYQDRFVKALALQQIKSIDKGNALLENGFIDKLNQKFEKLPRNPESAHRPTKGVNLNQILCWEYERQVQNDWTFSFSSKTYQIEKKYGSCLKPKTYIKVRKHMDGSVSAWNKEEALMIKTIQKTEKLNLNVTHAKVHEINTAAKTANISSWHKSNSFLFKPEDDLSTKTTMRKRQV